MSKRVSVRVWRHLRIRRGFGVALVTVVASLALAGWWCLWMPGASLAGPLPPLSEQQELEARRLEHDVRALAELGERSVRRPAALAAGIEYVRAAFVAAGLGPTLEEWDQDGVACANVVAERAGGAEIVLVGAHHDSAAGSPGANDDASGIAVLLALARRSAELPRARTLRFVAFASEEPPFFATERMGSAHHAQRALAGGERIVAMLALESMGCYRDEPGSQSYPLPALALVYPERGDYLAFVGGLGSRALVRTAVGAFRAAATLPSEGAVLPLSVPGVGWSDHRSFAAHDIPALMVTDTAPFRDARYHTPDDRPEFLDYARLARAVDGLEAVVRLLTAPDASPAATAGNAAGSGGG